MPIKFSHDSKPISRFVVWHKNHNLDLNPPFQRESVWRPPDRRRLIESIWNGYPLPAVFLYKHSVNGKTQYSVIDGKQRLEAILGFAGQLSRRGVPPYPITIEHEDGKEVIWWKDSKSAGDRKWLEKYELPIIYVNGDPSDIHNLFVRINSTGKTLSGQEKRKAKYLHSAFLRTAEILANQLVEKETGLFKKAISKSQIARLKHVEIVFELMVSIRNQDILDRKKSLDLVLSSNLLTAPEAKDAAKKVKAVSKLIETHFEGLGRTGRTRFLKLSDFYSLFFLIAKLKYFEHAVMNGPAAKKRWFEAWQVLKEFGLKVDKVSDASRQIKNLSGANKTCVEYLKTVKEGSDQRRQRMERERILRLLIGSIFAKKDSKRFFSEEQRRILWNSTNNKVCPICKGSRGPLTWSNYAVDHRIAHTKGGKTDLKNAQLVHGDFCNSSKGGK